MARIVGGDFETPGLWDEFRAQRLGSFVHGGAWAERLVSIDFFLGPISEPAWIAQVGTGLTGQTYTPRAWVYREGGATSASLWVTGSSTEAGPIDTFYENVPLVLLPLGVWTELVFTDIVLPPDNPTLGFYLTPPSFNQGTSTLWLDDVDFAGLDVGGDMAVMLLELPLRAMLATLQANLNAEIVHVGNEANDTFTPHSVERWYCWKRKDLAVDRCLVEVYEEGGSTFNDWDAQVSTWLQGQRVPLHSDHRIVVAVTFANRGLQPGTRTLKMSEMRVLAMRYAAAVVRTIRNSPTLGQGDNAIYCEPGSPAITYGLDDPTDAAPGSMRVEVPCIARIKESSAGETNVGGGIRPSAILEG